MLAIEGNIKIVSNKSRAQTYCVRLRIRIFLLNEIYVVYQIKAGNIVLNEANFELRIWFL